jgi:hypothetical protein
MRFTSSSTRASMSFAVILTRVFALQALVQRLDSLHFFQVLSCSGSGISYRGVHHVRRALKLVRAKGLEPPHLAILVPKTSASTSSATPAGAFGRVHEIARCRARPCGPRGAIADASPRARAQSPLFRGRNMLSTRGRNMLRARSLVNSRRVTMTSSPDPLPKPKPDTIEPQAPPEQPTQPTPQEDPRRPAERNPRPPRRRRYRPARPRPRRSAAAAGLTPRRQSLAC